uniref:Chromosome 5 C1orf21 homolog n=1 Tax=Equus caballus TaxID=9796 RepID=A0A9L0T6J5_HORSE
MGCASAKHVATVQNEEEAQKGKNYQNGDVFGDEYRIKPVEEVKYMKNGAEEEQKIAARNQENLVKEYPAGAPSLFPAINSKHSTPASREPPGAGSPESSSVTDVIFGSPPLKGAGPWQGYSYEIDSLLYLEWFFDCRLTRW